MYRLQGQAILVLLPSSCDGTAEVFIKYDVIGDENLARARRIYQISLMVGVESKEDSSGSTLCLLPIGFVDCYPAANDRWTAKDAVS